MANNVPDRKKIDNVILLAGGKADLRRSEIALSAKLIEHFVNSVSQFAIRMWYTRGINEKYSPYLAEQSGLSEAEIRKVGSTS
ncbi:MAG: hypothetical protein C0467_26215 [Planctomycetaceae bacterium]|nr:hypothetical protein [Planctomycetaceae bacterium]